MNEELELEFEELELVDLVDEHLSEKAKHRFSRKMKRLNNKREHCPTRNICIGATASRYGKRMLHRYNRRHSMEIASTTYYKNEYSLGTILWEMS